MQLRLNIVEALLLFPRHAAIKGYQSLPFVCQFVALLADSP